MAEVTIDRLRADIVEIGRRLYSRGFCASNDGNISIRFAPDRVLTTPKNVSKGYMTPDMMVVVDIDGKKVAGDRDASSELLMHLEVYRQRPDVNAVVHAHPPLATGFAVAGVPLDRAVLAEVICTLGSIPIVDYATPSTPELPAAVRQYIKAHDGLLLANHGALTVGAEVYGAYYKMETVEHFAKISLVARMLGGERLISQEEVLRLQALRGKYGIAAPAPICLDDDLSGSGGTIDATCQVVRAPEAAPGERLVPDPSSGVGAGRAAPAGGADGDAEIRLTYGELAALIEEAVDRLR